MRQSHLTTTSMLAGLAYLGLSTGAQAQQAVSDGRAANSANPGDIVVTARRVEERLQDVPISITVFNQQQLTNRDITTGQDLAIYTPSLSANSNFGSSNTTFAIRGFVQDIGTAPSVGVYFADVVAPRGAAQGTSAGDGAGPGFLFDLQNVQVLKGPQGTLFGRNTTGGAVLLVPQKPTSQFGGFVEGSYGNYDMKRIQGTLNIPLSDVARFRIAVDHQDRDGYLKNTSGIGPSRFDDMNYTALRASLVVDLAPDLENYTIFSYSKTHTNGDLQKLIGCDTSSSPANFLGFLSCAQVASHKNDGFYTVQNGVFSDPKFRLEQFQFINTTTWKAGDTITIKNIASYAQLREFDRSSLFGADWYLGSLQLPFTGISPAPGANTADQNTVTEELQLQGSGLNDRLTYQVGGYLEISDPLGLSGNRNPQLIVCQDIATFECNPVLGTSSVVNSKIGQTYFHDNGLYAQASYGLTDKLKLTGGFRYTWDKEKATVSGLSYSFPAANTPITHCTDASTSVLPNCIISTQVKSKAPTWLVDLDYKPIEQVLLYAKYSRGYRAGGVFPNSPSNYRVFRPERVEAYEVGLKSSFRGAMRGTFNVSGFYNDFTNQQLEVGFNARPGATVGPTTGVVNAGKSRIYGAEVEASLTPFRGFTLDGSYTYLHARIRSIRPLVSTDPNYTINNQIQPGDVLPLSPTNKLAMTASYQLPLDPSVGRVTAEATFAYTSTMLTTYAYENPTLRADYGGANLGLLQPEKLGNFNVSWNSVASLPVDLSFFVNNLTGEKYYTYVPGLGPSGFEAAQIGAPRMYGARLRYRFGA